MKLITIILASLAFFLTACNSKPPKVNILQERVVVDANGYKYRLVSPEKKLDNGMIQMELWERIDPLVTNRWYTPTLSSKYNTNNPMVFNSLAR